MFTIAFSSNAKDENSRIIFKDFNCSLVFSYRKSASTKAAQNYFDRLFIENINPRKKYIAGACQYAKSLSVCKNHNGRALPKVYACLRLGVEDNWEWGVEFNLPDLRDRFLRTRVDIAPNVRSNVPNILFTELYGGMLSPSILPIITSPPTK